MGVAGMIFTAPKRSSQRKKAALASGFKLRNQSELLAILLNARGAQSGQSIFFEGALPGEIFFCGERVALAGFFEAQQAAADCCHHFGLTPDDPAMAAGWWQI
jgi:hypothetical protein